MYVNGFDFFWLIILFYFKVLIDFFYNIIPVICIFTYKTKTGLSIYVIFWLMIIKLTNYFKNKVKRNSIKIYYSKFLKYSKFQEKYLGENNLIYDGIFY